MSNSHEIQTDNHLVCKQTLNRLAKLAGQMIELFCEYLPVQCIWLYVIIMSRMHFRVNLLSIVAWISKNSLPKTRNIWSLSNSNRIWTHNH